MKTSIVRTLMAGIIGPLFLVPLYFGGYVLLGFCALVTIGMLVEFYRFSKHELSAFRLTIVAIFCVLVECAVFIGDGASIASTIVAVTIINFALELREPISDTTYRAGTSLLLFAMCGLLVSGFIAVRQIHVFWAIMPIVTVWTVDTFAYWGGSLIGKHKFAPEISPNKTVEGALCGFASAFLPVWVGSMFYHDAGTFDLIVCALTAGVSGQLGDLFESKIKRRFAVKDTGSVFPGHGGVWDRTDSLLWVYSILWIYFAAKG
jgi:phosphatidate cytidylyltransferase